MYQIRQEVLRTAHQLKKSGLSFSEAQKKAWENYRLKSAMHRQPVLFTFRKVDGTERMALGSLETRYMETVKGTGKASATVTNYFDLERNSWRSFRIENLVRVNAPAF